MFQTAVNTACNNTAFIVPTILPMQEGDITESTARLYRAMKELANVEGKSAVAYYLNESPQTVHNWESRSGVSKEGALKAQARVGCDANWILSGEGGMRLGWPFKRVPMQRFLALGSDDRTFVEGVLAREIERLSPDSQASDDERQPKTSQRPRTITPARNPSRPPHKKSA